MNGVCAPVKACESGFESARYPSRTYSVLCFSNERDIANYVLIPIEGAGFVVIKHEFEVEE